MPELRPTPYRAPEAAASSSSSARPFRPHDEPRRGEHALGRLQQLGAKGRVLALEIDLRNPDLGHGSSGFPSRRACPSVPARAG